MLKTRCYSELKKLQSFDEKFDYLKLKGVVGESTFGFDRYLNQVLYHSSEWFKVRDLIIVRDNGCDLGDFDREIHGRIIIHHMNPITEEEILNRSDLIFDPEFLISTSFETHNAIHYGDASLLSNRFIERSPRDTILW